MASRSGRGGRRSSLSPPWRAALAGLQAAQVAPYDLVLRNARIVDGTGSPGSAPTSGSAATRSPVSRRRLDGPASRTIDVEQVVAPGFIDIHSHAARGIFEIPTADNYVRQERRRLVAGPDGSSPVPVAPFLANPRRCTRPQRRDVHRPGLDSVRGDRRSQSHCERRRAAEDARARRAGDEGRGVRSQHGSLYVPGTFTPTDEVVELAKVAGRFGGIHVSHMRDETAGVLDSVNETIAIGERGGLPTQVTHHKIIGRPNWGKSIEQCCRPSIARGPAASTSPSTHPTRPRARASRERSYRRGRRRGSQADADPSGDAGTRAKVKAEIVRIIQNERRWRSPEYRYRRL